MKTNKEKIKAFVKDHKKEIALGVVGVGAGVVGLVIGKKVRSDIKAQPKYIEVVGTNSDLFHDMIVELKNAREGGKETFLSMDYPYKISDLGKLGKDMMDDLHDGNFVVDKFIVF